MTTSPKRTSKRKTTEPTTASPVSHAAHMELLQMREQGKTVMYKQDAWGHIETRFVRTQNVKAWQEKGFVVQ